MKADRAAKAKAEKQKEKDRIKALLLEKEEKWER